MLWVDKHRPRTLDKIIVHEDIARNLKMLVLSSQPYGNALLFLGFWDLILRFCLGLGAGLPAFAVLWPVRVREEDAGHGLAQADVWR